MGCPKWSPKFNQLAYADDTIMFGSGDRYSIIQMMKTISSYERVSGQKVNKNDNSSMYMVMSSRYYY